MPVHDWNAFPEHLLSSGILIVGSGAVGLAMASHLARQGVPVTVLEAGPPTPPADWQARNAGPCTGLPHCALSVARMKALGGTTRLWHGQLLPLSHRDLAGWPLAYADYRAAVAQALDLLGVSAREADSDGMWRRRHTAKVRLDDAALIPGEANIALSCEPALSLWEVRQEAAGL